MGLRELWLRRGGLGAQLTEEGGDESWGRDEYLYGPVSLGLAASALNEVAQHCEDLFALTSFIRDPYNFVARITAYSAGKVTAVAPKLAAASNERLCALFMVPGRATMGAGLAYSTDPAACEAAVQDSEAALGDLVRRVTGWYQENAFFHNQYKHGLKIGLQPFGTSPVDTITERRQGKPEVEVFAFQNENLPDVLRKPPSQQGLMFPMPPQRLRPHLNELIENRALLRYQTTRVNIDHLAALSWDVMRLQRILATNRLSLIDGLDTNSQQQFVLPRQSRSGNLRIELRLAVPVKVNDFPNKI